MEKIEKVMEKVMENHGFFCNLKSTNPLMTHEKLNAPSNLCAIKV